MQRLRQSLESPVTLLQLLEMCLGLSMGFLNLSAIFCLYLVGGNRITPQPVTGCIENAPGRYNFLGSRSAEVSSVALPEA
jgi:hypothetical protein